MYTILLFYCELNKFRSTFKISETNFSDNPNLLISHARMLIHFYLIEHYLLSFILSNTFPSF